MWVLAQCERFHCLPSQLLKEDAALMQMLAIEQEVRGDGW